MKKETIEEFLARGGTITKVPPVEREAQTATIPTKTTISPELMSLGEGEFLFGERTGKAKPMKKRVSDEAFKGLLETSGLPQSVIDAIKGSMKNEQE